MGDQLHSAAQELKTNQLELVIENFPLNVMRAKQGWRISFIKLHPDRFKQAVEIVLLLL